VLDAELASLLWILAETGTPLVVAAPNADAADELRAAVAELASAAAGLADMRLPGRSIVGAATLEEVVAQADPRATATVDAVPDAARDLGLVVIIGPPDADGRARVSSAHYLRPIERDAAGHLQRRPPAVLVAWNERAGTLDHFDWGITDELATRARLGVAEFARLQQQRATLLGSRDASRRDAPN
jgi:hypothetical protein